MSNRLLTLLTEIEQALIANDPSPEGGLWDTLRLINFRQGLARLTLSVRSPARVISSQGIILLQDFTLADGTQCVKASLNWEGIEKSTVYSIYSKPQLDWHREAGQIAAVWLDGHVAAVEARTAATGNPSAPLMSASA